MILFIFIGILSGLLTGLSGTGSVVMIPLLSFAGLTIAEALSIVLAVHILPTSLPALYLYLKKGKFRYKEAIAVIIGVTVGIFIGTFLVTKCNISEKRMSIIIGSIMIAVGLVMIFGVGYHK